jgi:hypothetical protein
MIDAQKKRYDDTAIVSVTTRNYIYRARELFDSVEEFLPEAQRIVCCADSWEGAGMLEDNLFEVIEAASLGIPRYSQLALALNPTALCCLLKPFIAKHAFEKHSIQKVIYIDNDIGLYRRPVELLNLLDCKSIVLTPHHLQPLPENSIPNEENLFRFGLCNAGMFGVSRQSESIDFMSWWANWMLEPRRLHVHSGYDQVWLNFALAYCPQSVVLHDPTYNVAFWNLQERKFEARDEGFYCNGKPLATFHFSCFDENYNDRLVGPKTEWTFPWDESQKQIAADILQKWNKAGRKECLSLGYGYSAWPDGKKISASERARVIQNWDKIPSNINFWEADFPQQHPDLFHLIRDVEKIAKPDPWYRKCVRFILDLSVRKILNSLLGLAGIKK